jgi:hypothetical protein
MVTTEMLANLVLLGIGGYVNFGAVARTRQRDPDSGCPGPFDHACAPMPGLRPVVQVP